MVRPLRPLALGLVIALAPALAGCTSAGYLWQSTRGHLAIVRAARPVPSWLEDAGTSPELAQRLRRAQQMRDWAVRELHLPDNDSYRRYADLHRKAAVWNVVATPPLSLQLFTSCFPVVGCVGYQGYYDEAAAQARADELKAQGLETYVYSVPAYSTLGWSNWLGGDPLLNTFIGYPEGELARMIFHELTHQVVFVKGDTTFNESFASTVELLGVRRWLAEQADEEARRQQEQAEQRRQDFRRLTTQAREALQAAYAAGPDDAARRAAQDRILAELRARHAELKAGPWQGYTGYDTWFAQAGNPSLAIVGSYTSRIPAFEQLFREQHEDFERFYEAVRQLADQPAPQRDAALDALERRACDQPRAASSPTACAEGESSKPAPPR